MNKLIITIILSLTIPSFISAEEIKVPINLVSIIGIHDKIGTITFRDSKEGLVIKAKLKGLLPGEHGFHIHENPSCQIGFKDGKIEAAYSAGSHYDPNKTNKHLGPEGEGHAGDLPKLVFNKDMVADSKEMLVPRLKVADIKNRSVVIHTSGDNYSDEPNPLGGGGGRVACGVVK